nr:hypothetical protein Iba_chr01eCG8780 [Ipomoea batatas]
MLTERKTSNNIVMLPERHLSSNNIIMLTENNSPRN